MEDDCFAKSPFSSVPLVSFLFKGGSHLSVEQSLLQRNPKLALLIPLSPCPHCRTSSQSLSLKNISRSAGHTLIHYLHTNTYQVLEWLGPTTSREETTAKLKISLEVYATSRKYELDGLEALAKEQISLLSKDLDAFTIIDTIHEIYPSSSDKDTWFPTYMKAVVKTAFESSTAPAKSEIRDPSEGEQEGSVSTAKALLRGALEAYRETVEALAVNYAPVIPEKPTPAINSPHIKNDGRGRSETAEETEDKTNILAALEEIRVNDPVRQAKPDPNPVDTVKGIKNGKVEKSCAAIEEPQVGEQPAEPKPTPKLQEEANAATGNTTDRSPSGGLFGGTSTAGAIFGAKDNATTGGVPPGATSLPFTPFMEKSTSYSFNSGFDSFQNILFTEAYRGWSSEELRLDDYNHGRKQGSAGLGSSAQTNTGCGDIKASPWFTNAGGFGSSGFRGFTSNTATIPYVGNLFGAKPAASTSTSTFGGFGGGGFGAKPTTATSTGTTGFGSSSGFGSGGSSFGTNFATTTNTSTGFGSSGGFGSSTAGFGSSSGFGSSTAGFGSSSSGFGSSTARFGSSSSGFGSSTAGFGSSSGFGSSAAGFGSSGFGSSTTGFGTKPATATNTETTGFSSSSSFGFGSNGSSFGGSRSAHS